MDHVCLTVEMLTVNCSVQNECKRFQNVRPVMRQIYIYTFIYERSFLAGQTFQISNFASDDTCLKYPVCVCVLN